MAERDILWADIERAAEHRDPQLAELILRFLAQPDPPPGQPEQPPDDPDAEPVAVAQDAWTLDRLRHSVGPLTLRGKTPDERKTLRRGAWNALLAAPNPPPRLRLGQLLLALYQADDEPARSSLLALFAGLPSNALGWGLWQGFKGIFKLAEQRHDLAMLGVLSYRLDAQQRWGPDVSRGTGLYMRRRAWRYLRQLGQALPELYPDFAVQVLRHYPPRQNFRHCWVANQIWGHANLIGRTDQGGGYSAGPDTRSPEQLDRRAFDDSWKLSPAPLLQLLQDAANDQVCAFAIHGLEQDFPEQLRDADPAWLARIGAKPLPSVQTFVVKLLRDSPAFHQSKLKALGLHDMVLGLLYSDSAQARGYALDYARAYGKDMATPALVALALNTATAAEVKTFALSVLETRPPDQIGIDALLRLLISRDGNTKTFAAAALNRGFRPADISAEQLVELILRAPSTAYNDILTFYKNAKQRPPVTFYCRLLDDPRGNLRTQRLALNALQHYSGQEIGSDWLQQALLKPALSATVASWLRRGMLAGDALDIDWLKGLVMRPALRPLALELLNNHDLVPPEKIGLPWLLALARSRDDSLHNFAQDYLLASFRPQDFASAELSGAQRLWQLAGGADQPEPIRRLAARFLTAHHPTLGSKQPGFTPGLNHDDYPPDRLLPLFDDPRPDLRRLAATLAGPELTRWNRPELLYRLADSRYREPRQFAIEQLLTIDENGGESTALPSDWLLPGPLFALAESRHKASREAALTLIRRHYRRIGGSDKLAWLMESPDREVGLFAVRLLWDQHRPVAIPVTWQPTNTKTPWQKPDPQLDAPEALQQFLRKTLFGLPPGRMERRETANALPDRPLAASVSKRRLIAVIKDLALTDREFAALVTPVLGEFRHSRAKGEWQHCVAALAQIRRAHPGLAATIDLPAAIAS